MNKTVVLNVVGLTPRLIGQGTPNIKAFADRGAVAAVRPVLPAVTTTVQATYLTGAYPSEHGIVANGWYFRDECEIKFWRQSNRLVQREPVWEVARRLDPTFTCANLFWWYNMYSSADYAATPRPMYPADGRKVPDVYTKPVGLRSALQEELGRFPLFSYWGPKTSIEASKWIAGAAKWVDARHDPTLTLVYLPHLDYCLQREGPERADRITKDLHEVDAVVGDLLDHYRGRGARVILLSEYGITPVRRPVHINRLLREAGLITVREEMGGELLDAGASAAFAVADHQVAHVYVNRPEALPRVKALLETAQGIAQVLDEGGKRAHHLDHPRAGDLVAVAEPDAWFTYYYWLNDRRAPDFARTVDIHRKPGYDPVELFVDPRLRAPQVKVAWTLLRKQLGFRCLIDVVPLDASLVRGSHGVYPTAPEDGPLVITEGDGLLDKPTIDATEVFHLMLRCLTPARTKAAPGG